MGAIAFAWKQVATMGRSHRGAASIGCITMQSTGQAGAHSSQRQPQRQ